MRMIKTAVIAFLVAGIIGFGLGFLFTSRGLPVPYEVTLISAILGMFVALISWNLSGNRKISKADVQQLQQALGFVPPEGRAFLYVIRKGFVAKAAGMDISLGGELRAHLKSPQFTCLNVAPGPHELHATFGGGAGAQCRPVTQMVELHAGDAVGALMTAHLGALKGAIRVEMLITDQVRPIVRGMKMAAPHVSNQPEIVSSS